jgi:hypothetical protein
VAIWAVRHHGDEASMDSGDGFEPLPAALADSMLLAFDPIAIAAAIRAG